MRSSFQASATNNLQTSLSVSQLNQRAKQLVEQGLFSLWVEGEVSNFMASSAGHWYFTLKDARAQVACVMFAGRNSLVAKRPVNGDQITVKADASFYAERGQFQLLVEGLSFSGAGALLAQFEAVKAKLAAEGVFAADNKLALPAFPKTIGVITSAQGAALRDVLKVLARRWPIARVVVYPAVVQGQDSPASLRRALAHAQYSGQPEVLLLVRGGGSLEDLQAFNDETLARMVAASPIPVITGVGHETDFTLVDFAADLRAPTPSVAAETASPNKEELQQRLVQQLQRLTSLLKAQLTPKQQKLDYLAQQALAPLKRLQQEQQKLQYLVRHLAAQHPQRKLEHNKQRLLNLEARLQATQPLRQVASLQNNLVGLLHNLNKYQAQSVQLHKLSLGNLAGRLGNLSPLSTLARGYALAEQQDKTLVRQASQLQLGENLTLWLGKGAAVCKVESILPEARKV